MDSNKTTPKISLNFETFSINDKYVLPSNYLSFPKHQINTSAQKYKVIFKEKNPNIKLVLSNKCYNPPSIPTQQQKFGYYQTTSGQLYCFQDSLSTMKDNSVSKMLH